MNGYPEHFEPSLNSPYTPYTPNISNELNTSNQSGVFVNLKKLILTRCNAWGGKQIEGTETLGTLVIFSIFIIFSTLVIFGGVIHNTQATQATQATHDVLIEGNGVV